jgi:uncharacterized phosphosugar-binding protein
MQQQYFDFMIERLQTIKDKESVNIIKAAKLVSDTIINGNWVYTFGSGHSQLLAMEVHSRAGGLYPVVHIPDPMNGRAEKVEGFGPILIEGMKFKKGETIFVISNSGRNPEPIEIAMSAKQMGVNVIVISSMEHSKLTTSRHSSGKMLFEIGDVVIDSHTPSGDTAMSFPNSLVKAGALSTILGAAIMNAVMVDAIQNMLDKGYEPPVLISSNLDGSDKHNQDIMEKYGPFPQPRFI